MSTGIRIGEVTIERIVELEGPFLPALDMFAELTPALLDEHRHWLAPDALDADGMLRLCFQSYVVRTPHHTILIDSCIGNDKERPNRPAWHMKRDDTFMKGLAAIGLAPADIDVVMCTHLHVDHVGWNTRLENGRWVPTFPNARYIFGATEFAHWTATNDKTPVAPFIDSVLPVVAARQADIVAEDYAVGEHLRLLATPGHTPGHVSVLLGKGRDDALFTGDILHSPLQLRHPELSPKFDVDPALAARTRRAVLERLCDTATLCCTAHFPSPSVGRIRREGSGFRCDPLDA